MLQGTCGPGEAGMRRIMPKNAETSLNLAIGRGKFYMYRPTQSSAIIAVGFVFAGVLNNVYSVVAPL